MVDMKQTVKKKDVALVFGITSDYVFALANTLIGLMRHNKKFWDDIIVYHDGVSVEDMDNINRIVDVKFIDLSEVDQFRKIAESGIKTIKKYSIATFYRYECLNLLEKYHRVIWNDVDILIQGDISGLLDYGNENGVAFSMAEPGFIMGSSVRKIMDEYKMFVPLWNVGIMVFTDKLENFEEVYDWCIEATDKYRDELLWPDLAVLNMALQKFDITPENIEAEKYVCLPISESVDKAVIIHAYGDKKFWNNLEYLEDNPEWRENAIKWSRIEFKKYEDEKPKVSCVLSCYERYDFLVEAIDSLLAQSFANFEIIVVLEKSKVQAEIEKVLKGINDKRIIIIKNKNKLGFPASLNVGIDAARGDYIARMDDDDVSLPCRFAAQVKYLDEHDSVGIVGSDMAVFGRENSYASTFVSDKYIKAITLVESPFKHPTVMMRKKVLDENNLRYDPDYFTEDYELWSRLVYLTDTANIGEALVCYRSHDLQATSSGTNSNEPKIHSSHKRVIDNQMKERLGLSLFDNELELLQTRKDYKDSIADYEGAIDMRDLAVMKILKTNEEKQVYDENILNYLLNDRANGIFEEKTERELESKYGRINAKSRGKSKKLVKKIIGKAINPIYARLLDRMEKVMIKHDNEVQAELQWQINDIKRRQN